MTALNQSPTSSPRRALAVTAGLALLAGCATTPHFNEQDISNLSPQGRAFVSAAAEHCRVKPVAVMEAFTQRPLFLSVVQDAASGEFAAMFVRDPLAAAPERIVLTQEELMRPERLQALGQALQRPGQKCVAALVDFQNTKRAVSEIAAARVIDFLRKLPERPDNDTPTLQPKPSENVI